MRTKIKQLFAKSAEYADKEVEIYAGYVLIVRRLNLAF